MISWGASFSFYVICLFVWLVLKCILFANKMFKPTPFDKLLQQQPRSVILNRRGLFYIGASLVPKCPKILTDSWTNWRVGQFKDAMEADKPGRPNPRYESKSLDVGLFDICTPLWRLVLQLMPSGHYDPQNSRRCPFKSVHISPWQTLTPSSPQTRSGSKPLDIGLFDIGTALEALVVPLVPGGEGLQPTAPPEKPRRAPAPSQSSWVRHWTPDRAQRAGGQSIPTECLRPV